jgi:hypothetical protein
MKTPEDEAFDDIERRQLNGHQIKRIQAMARINEDFDEEYQKMHEDRIKYGTSWSKNGERIDPRRVYLDEPAQDGKCKYCVDGCAACDARAQPVQREWVGLTDEEIKGLWVSRVSWTNNNFARAIEQLLKEKNG